MSNNVRIGDRVYLTHHMSHKGVVTEIFLEIFLQEFNLGLCQSRCL